MTTPSISHGNGHGTLGTGLTNDESIEFFDDFDGSELLVMMVIMIMIVVVAFRGCC